MIKGLRCPSDNSPHDWQQCCNVCPSLCRAQPIIKAMWDDAERNDAFEHPAWEITVTSAIGGCTWEWALQQLGTHVPIDRLFAISRGKAVHKWIEQAFRDDPFPWVVEQRLGVELPNGIVIYGTPDAYNTATHQLWDWKTTAARSSKYLPKEDHGWQLNAYRVMLEAVSGHPVASMHVAYWHDYNIEQFEMGYIPDEEVVAKLSDGAARLDRVRKAPVGEPLRKTHPEPEGPKLFNGQKCEKYCLAKFECPLYRDATGG